MMAMHVGVMGEAVMLKAACSIMARYEQTYVAVEKEE